MDLNYLRAFFEVAKSGKFSQAAKHLNISQSALSRSVALLEAQAGLQLFERSKQGVTLTPKGQEIFLRAEQLFQTEREIDNLCRGIKESCEGAFRFAATDHVINYFLVPHIHKFRERFPKVVPSILSGTPDEMIDSLFKTENEFVLLFSKLEIPQITFTRLHPTVMALVCEPGLWKKNKGATSEKTLKSVIKSAGYLCSMDALLKNRTSRVLRELFGESPQVGVETNSQEAQKRLCLEGGGVAYLSRFMVEKEIEEGKLFEIPVDHPHIFHLWMAKKKGHQLSLTARTFLEQIGPTTG